METEEEAGYKWMRRTVLYFMYCSKSFGLHHIVSGEPGLGVADKD